VIYAWEARQDEQLLERLKSRINRPNTAGSSDSNEDEGLKEKPVSHAEDELVLQNAQDEN
jgi:hypothetical protein